MAMRSDCRHYDSRTYASGEVVRKCRLDLAPEAPWRCPEDCGAFELRRIDIGWQYGSLASAVTPAEPAPVTADDASIAALLDEAEEIVNAAAPDILAELDRGGRRKLLRRKSGEGGKATGAKGSKKGKKKKKK
jgi:hypothetical protein